MKTLTNNKAFWLLLLICIITVLPFLGLYDYNTKGEPRESIVSYTMLETGNWVLPRNNGGEMAYKPPFFHWCVAGVSAINGKVTEMTSRMPSAVAFIILVMVTFAFYLKRKGQKVAFISALLMLGCLELVRASCNCRVDMVLTMLTVCALYCFYEWYERNLRGIPWLAIILMSLGTLTKGPVGAIIPCLVTGIFLLIRGVKFYKAFFLLLLFGVMSLIIPAIWYVAAYHQGGQAFLDLMYEENIGRMTNTMSYDSCVNPWPYNILTLIVGYLPWTLLLIISLFGLSYHKLDGGASTLWHRFVAWVKNMEPLDLFSSAAIVIIFVFYCIPQSKRSVYLMPMYPFMAYFIARYIMWLTAKRAKTITVYGGIISVVGILLFVTFIVVKCGFIPDTIFHGRHAIQNIAMLHALENVTGILAWTCAIIPTVLCIYWWKYTSNHKVDDGYIYGMLAMVIAVFLAVNGSYKPGILNAKSSKPIALQIDKLAPQNQGKLYEYIEGGVKAKGDPVHFFEINFYLDNRIGSFYHEQPSSGFLLIGDDDARNDLGQYVKKGYHFELRHQLYNKGNGQTLFLYHFLREKV